MNRNHFKIYLYTIAITGILLIVFACTQHQDVASEIFPRGTLNSPDRFTGNVWGHPLVQTDSVFNYSVSNVTFAPRARTNYHRHDEGQILICVSGRGWYQERGKEPVRLNPGDVVKIPPHVDHWHGAARDSEFSHLSMIPHQLKDRGSEWQEAVSDKEYNLLK